MPRQEPSHRPGASVAPEDGAAHVGAALDYVTDAVILLRHDWTIEFVNVATAFEMYLALLGATDHRSFTS